MDLYDSKGENPYEIEEVLKDKVWRVTYSGEAMFYTRSKMKKPGSFSDPTVGKYRSKVLNAAKRYGDEVVRIAENDLNLAETWFKKGDVPKNELFDIPPFKLNMVVVKLESGGILLYAPVNLHKEVPELLFSWLESLGPVEWLVAASSAHDMCLPDAIKAFPKAKVVGSEFIEEKLKYVKVCFHN